MSRKKRTINGYVRQEWLTHSTAGDDPTDEPDYSQAPLSAERALALGVFHQAVDDCYRYGGVEGDIARRICNGLRSWLHNTEHDWIYSYTGICGILGVEPGAIRTRLLHILDHGGTKPRVEFSRMGRPAKPTTGVRYQSAASRRERRALTDIARRV